MRLLSEKSIIVCGIVRDAERGLKKNIPVIQQLCRRVKDYHVVIYENDSRDHTKQLLSRWQQEDPAHVHVSLNDISRASIVPGFGEVTCNPYSSHNRIDRMARLRNRYMEYIDDRAWAADYLIVVDLDVAQLYLDGIVSSLEDERPWDAVAANGYSLSPMFKRRYHDVFALTLPGDEDAPQTEEKMVRLSNELGSMKPGDPWMRVYSAFGGLAIYRYEAVKGLRYEALPNDDAWTEVRCEHYSIYKQMVMRGYNHFYINPSMELHYRRLTLRVMWDSACRKINKIIKTRCRAVTK